MSTDDIQAQLLRDLPLALPAHLEAPAAALVALVLDACDLAGLEPDVEAALGAWSLLLRGEVAPPAREALEALLEAAGEPPDAEPGAVLELLEALALLAAVRAVGGFGAVA